jgi:hypothetical protein
MNFWEILRRGVSMKSALISSVLFLAVAGSAFAADNGSNSTNGSNNIESNTGNGVGNGVGNGNVTISATGAAPQAWEGYATVTASTARCSGLAGTTPGDTQVSIFRPKIASTDLPTFLSFVFLRAAVTQENMSESIVHQMNGSGNYTGFAIGARAGFAQYTGTYNLTITPAPITAATPSLMINGTITNYFNTTGCNVTFEGAYVQRID